MSLLKAKFFIKATSEECDDIPRILKPTFLTLYPSKRTRIGLKGDTVYSVRT